MERRHDRPFRGLVDAIHPDLAAEGFCVADRGRLENVSWVDYQRRTRATNDRIPGEQNLVLYHLGGHGHIGARLSRYDLLGHTVAPADASVVWPYEPQTLTTRAGQPLAHALLDWLHGTLGARGD